MTSFGIQHTRSKTGHKKQFQIQLLDVGSATIHIIAQENKNHLMKQQFSCIKQKFKMILTRTHHA